MNKQNAYKNITIGFIMDGNRRWAIKNKTTLEIAYQKGSETFINSIIICLKYKISIIVFYALSHDNFKNRSQKELNIIYHIGILELNKNKLFFIKNKIKIIFIGEKKILEQSILNNINIIENETNINNNIMTIFILLIYDPYKDVFNNGHNLLYSSSIPNIDLIIRSGGHNRLSGFLPIQSINANIICIKELWPEISQEVLYKILKNYKKNQNYGK